MPPSNYSFTRLEARLFFALLILFPIKLIVFMFVSADSASMPDPHGGRTYLIKGISRGGQRWYLWVDHADWIINTVLTWVTWTVALALLASVLFHRYRAYWRSKNEGRPQ